MQQNRFTLNRGNTPPPEAPQGFRVNVHDQEFHRDRRLRDAQQRADRFHLVKMLQGLIILIIVAVQMTISNPYSIERFRKRFFNRTKTHVKEA